MRASLLVARSLAHYWRTGLGVLLGFALAAAILVGALLVGESVRASLREAALERIGGVDLALASGDRLFRAELAGGLAKHAPELGFAPVLALAAVASADGGAQRAGSVSLYGAPPAMLALGTRPYSGTHPGRSEVLLNERLAAQLGAKAGDTILVRVEKPSALPRDMVLAQTEDATRALRLTVLDVLTGAELGNFGLTASAVPPYNAFVDLEWLQSELELEGRANAILARVSEGTGTSSAAAAARADAAIAAAWTLADAELELRPLERALELSSPRVFLDTFVEDAVRGLPGAHLGVLTYFVNALRLGERATPYSMVSALGPLGVLVAPQGATAAAELARVLPGDPDASGLVLGAWAADDLGAKVGDEVSLAYFVPGPSRRLEEATRAFTVRAIAKDGGLASDASLMPAFPGLGDAENCRDWETGVPVELDAIRDKDEAYWDEYKGTPKAFLPLAEGQALWANRFGSLTAVRSYGVTVADFERGLRATLDPRDFGLFFRDVRGPALAAGTSATDFGGLFIGLSFFLIAAALLLAALLFVFGVEQRGSEIGLLFAVGFTPGQVRRLFLLEAGALAAIGAALGALAGTVYTKLVLRGLATVWQGAVASTPLAYHGSAQTIAMGALAALAVALAASAWALRGQARRSALELLAASEGVQTEAAAAEPRRARVSLGVAALALVAAVGLGLRADPSRGLAAAGAFFGVGALLLVAGLAASRYCLTHLRGGRDAYPRSLLALGLRNASRRPGRSLATVALLASGTFLVLSIGAHHKSGSAEATGRVSGTGGFALFGRSKLGLFHDLATAEGRDATGLTEADLAGVAIVPMRVREGDDASCLNLGSPQVPELVGVAPELLAERGAFSFAETLGKEVGASPWSLLSRVDPEGAIPAIADAASVTWTLKKKVGDTLEYTDERGEPFQVRIVATVAGSILQGSLFIAEDAFQAKFPSAAGYGMFLIDAPPERVGEVAATLSRALSAEGLELTSATRRLDEFHSVQNTYLQIFQILGGLGVLLGSVGLGVVVLRNALERRRELALLSAVGYTRRNLRALFFSEHGLLLVLGLGVGLVAALMALVPVVRAAGAGASSSTLIPLIVAIVLNGAFWVWLGTLTIGRGPLIEGLRRE